MPAKLRRFYILVIIFALLASCGQPLNDNGSDSPVTPIKTFETEPVSNVVLAKTLISDANYLDQCKTINAQKLTEQISYQNILPGKTMASEVEAILGIPNETSVFRGVTTMMYDNPGFFVEIENDVVTYIVVDPDKESKLPITLEEVVLKYGCPDFVLAANTSEDQVGYNSIRFIYTTIGLEVSFTNYPGSLGSNADSISYFPPVTVQEYFEKYEWANNSWSAQPVEWSDAVK